LIFVDDCSSDATFAQLAAIARADPRVVAVQLARNSGQGAATLCGIERAAGGIVFTLDDDLQHVPEEIPKLLAVLASSAGYDVVFGVPWSRRHPVWRRAASWSVNLAFSPLLRKPSALRFTGFRAIRRRCARQLVAMRWPDPFLSALLFQLTPHIGVAYVEHASSNLASSRYSIGKLVRIPLGYISALPDRARTRRAAAAIVTGMLGLLAGSASLQFVPKPLGIVVGTASVAIAAPLLVLGLAMIMLGWRVAAYRRKSAPAVSARRMIADGQEIAASGWNGRTGVASVL
jgi:hypothetical protein